jgi:hypothetical protein
VKNFNIVIIDYLFPTLTEGQSRPAGRAIDRNILFEIAVHGTPDEGGKLRRNISQLQLLRNGGKAIALAKA